jgi:hypothetical protein
MLGIVEVTKLCYGLFFCRVVDVAAVGSSSERPSGRAEPSSLQFACSASIEELDQLSVVRWALSGHISQLGVTEGGDPVRVWRRRRRAIS